MRKSYAEIYYSNKDNEMIIVYCADLALCPLIIIEHCGWYQSRFKTELNPELILVGEL